jgi:hypothetical protein
LLLSVMQAASKMSCLRLIAPEPKGMQADSFEGCLQ